jgi:hypothetical protein
MRINGRILNMKIGNNLMLYNVSIDFNTEVELIDARINQYWKSFRARKKSYSLSVQGNYNQGSAGTGKFNMTELYSYLSLENFIMFGDFSTGGTYYAGYGIIRNIKIDAQNNNAAKLSFEVVGTSAFTGYNTTVTPPTAPTFSWQTVKSENFASWVSGAPSGWTLITDGAQNTGYKIEDNSGKLRATLTTDTPYSSPEYSNGYVSSKIIGIRWDGLDTGKLHRVSLTQTATDSGEDPALNQCWTPWAAGIMNGLGGQTNVQFTPNNSLFDLYFRILATTNTTAKYIEIDNILIEKYDVTP